MLAFYQYVEVVEGSFPEAWKVRMEAEEKFSIKDRQDVENWK